LSKRLSHLGISLTTQAILDANNDHIYPDVIENIHATIFIGTPHRGVVRSTFWRDFLADSSSEQTLLDQVNRNAGMIREIDDAFRTISNRKFQVTSFYEMGRMHGGVSPRQFPSNLVDICPQIFRDIETAR